MTNTSSLVVGIDPGASGGFCMLGNKQWRVKEMPDSISGIAQLIQSFVYDYQVTEFAVEQISPGGIFKTSKSSNIKLYGNYREIVSVLEVHHQIEAINYQIVWPKKWQKHFDLKRTDAEKEKQSLWKKKLQLKAKELFPYREKELTQKVCDAALIAKYWSDQLAS